MWYLVKHYTSKLDRKLTRDEHNINNYFNMLPKYTRDDRRVKFVKRFDGELGKLHPIFVAQLICISVIPIEQKEKLIRPLIIKWATHEELNKPHNLQCDNTFLITNRVIDQYQHILHHNRRLRPKSKE